jgi:RimJ/RimL family protein N-acetyltransferase
MTVRGTVCAFSAAAAESRGNYGLVLADGTRISLRQVDADDRAGMAALFARLTPQSRYQRFLSPKPALTPRELTFFTDIDHLNHEAIAAVDQRDDSIVGVARYVRYAGQADVAEVAIEVADALQRMGIGTALASLTIQHAHANGLRVLTATTLWENRAARGLLRHHGFRARQSRGGEIEHELKLEELGPATAKAAPRPRRGLPRPPSIQTVGAESAPGRERPQ